MIHRLADQSGQFRVFDLQMLPCRCKKYLNFEVKVLVWRNNLVKILILINVSRKIKKKKVLKCAEVKSKKKLQ